VGCLRKNFKRSIGKRVPQKGGDAGKGKIFGGGNPRKRGLAVKSSPRTSNQKKKEKNVKGLNPFEVSAGRSRGGHRGNGQTQPLYFTRPSP